MEQLKQMKEALTNCVQGQIYGNMDNVDTKELGEAVDMIKDLAEAIYYCTITEAMEKGEENGEKNKHGMMYYNERMMPMPTYPVEYYDPRNREKYAAEGGMSSNGYGSRGGRGYREGHIPIHGNEMMESRDPKEGKSGERRRMYLEGKYSGKDKAKQMQDLENYMQELGQDLAEMIQDASMEEKQLLQQKIAMLANKIK